MIASSSHTQSHTSITSAASNFCPIEGRNVSNKKLKTEKKGTEKETRAKIKGKEKAEPHIPAMFLGNDARNLTLGLGEPSGPSQVKKPVSNKHNPHNDNEDESDHDLSLNVAENETMMVANLANLVDVKKEPKLKSANARLRSGHPENALINDLVQQCYHKSRPEKPLYRCVSSCGTTYANRNLPQIVRHAKGCSHLSADLCSRAKAHAANQAPSRKLPIGDPESTKVDKHNKGTEDTNKMDGRHGAVVPVQVVVSKKRKVEEMGWFDEAKKLGHKERHQKLDLAVVKLICCSGIPSHISDLDVWKGVFAYADPTYKPASRAKLEETHIIGEAESIHEIQIVYLIWMPKSGSVRFSPNF
jgi:hypothetical protein